MFTTITKRDGRIVAYEREKIEHAIAKAMATVGRHDERECNRLAALVEERLFDKYASSIPGVEDIQDMVEAVLMDSGYAYVAKKYILYRLAARNHRQFNRKQGANNIDNEKCTVNQRGIGLQRADRQSFSFSFHHFI